MNFSYGAPPSASTGALKSLQPDFPTEAQPKVAVAYATEPPPPTYSTGMINTSDSQFPAVGQRALQTYESFLQPPQETAVRTLQNSNNQLSNRGWDDAYGGGGNISDLVHKNYSSTSAVDDPYNGGGAPGISDYARRDRSNNGSYTDDFNSPPNASHSMTGNRFKQAYKQFNQFES